MLLALCSAHLQKNKKVDGGGGSCVPPENVWLRLKRLARSGAFTVAARLYRELMEVLLVRRAARVGVRLTHEYGPTWLAGRQNVVLA